MTRELRNHFIHFVRLGLGHETVLGSMKDDSAMASDTLLDSGAVDWVALKALAGKQGLTAVVLDGIEEFKRLNVQGVQGIGEVIQDYEARYTDYEKAISSLAGFYNQHGYKMMVLKGYACSLNWPNPNHRPCGDIDVWQFGRQREADAALAREKGIKIDNSHHHHTVFYWRDFMVENHYDFVNVHAHRSSAKMEKVFKELGNFKVESGAFSVDSQLKGCSVEGCKISSVEVCGEKVYLPSANLHALFLIKHMVSHFAAAEISLRQVLDWAFFIKKHTKEIDWNWLNGMLEEYHMKDFVSCINAICVEDLGFEASIFGGFQFNPQLKNRILEDILEPEYGLAGPMGFFQSVIYKYKRWQGNAWKQRLCYNESRWESFWTGIWAKILKPASI